MPQFQLHRLCHVHHLPDRRMALSLPILTVRPASAAVAPSVSPKPVTAAIAPPGSPTNSSAASARRMPGRASKKPRQSRPHLKPLKSRPGAGFAEKGWTVRSWRTVGSSQSALTGASSAGSARTQFLACVSHQRHTGRDSPGQIWRVEPRIRRRAKEPKGVASVSTRRFFWTTV